MTRGISGRHQELMGRSVSLVLRRLGPPLSPAVWIAAGAALLAGAASFLLLGQINSASHPKGTVWYGIGIAVLVIGGLVFVVGVAEALRQWYESRTTPLDVAHHPQDDQCVQRRDNGSIEQVRIKVRNTGRFGLNHVRARLSKPGNYSHWLRLEHDNERPFHRSLVEGELAPADRDYWVYFDVAYVETTGMLVFEYADLSLRNRSSTNDPEHFITIRVWGSREKDGQSVVPAEVEWRVDVLDGGRDVRLTELRRTRRATTPKTMASN